MAISFFDCFCSVGKRSVKCAWETDTAGELLIKMDRYGIEKALVYHNLSKEYCPKLGNERLLQLGNDRLMPMWTLLPYVGEEFFDIGALKAELIENSISCVTLFPQQHNYSFSVWNLSEIFSLLEELSIPLFIDAPDFNDLHSILSEFGNLKIVIRNVGYRSDRMLIPLMKKFPHLYVQSMGYRVFFGIENLIEIFGAGRVLFGSGMPEHSGGGAVFEILASPLKEIEKEMIASKNLEQLLPLLGGVK